MGSSGSQGGLALQRDPPGLLSVRTAAGFVIDPLKGSPNQLLLASKTRFDTVRGIANAGEFR